MPAADAYVPGHGNRRFGVRAYDLDLDYRIATNHLSARAVLEVEAGRVLVLRTVRTPIIPIDATLTVLVESRWGDRTRLLALAIVVAACFF